MLNPVSDITTKLRTLEGELENAIRDEYITFAKTLRDKALPTPASAHSTDRKTDVLFEINEELRKTALNIVLSDRGYTNDANTTGMVDAARLKVAKEVMHAVYSYTLRSALKL